MTNLVTTRTLARAVFAGIIALLALTFDTTIRADIGKDPKQGPMNQRKDSKCEITTQPCVDYAVCVTENNDCISQGQTTTYPYAERSSVATYGFCSEAGPGFCNEYPSVICATIRVLAQKTIGGTCIETKCTFNYYAYNACAPPIE